MAQINDGKRERFVKLAERRVNNSIKTISLIGNLANKNNYKYDDADINKIISALKSEVAELEARFKTQRVAEKKFKL